MNVVRAAVNLQVTISCRLLAALASLGVTPRKMLRAWHEEENSVCVFFVPRVESCSGSRVLFVWSVVRLPSRAARLWSNNLRSSGFYLFIFYLICCNYLARCKVCKIYLVCFKVVKQNNIET